MLQIQTFSLTTAGRTPAPLTRQATASFPRGVGSGVSLRAVRATLRAWRQRRVERAALQSLLMASDHILDDIGISRHEVHQILWNL